MANVGNTWQYEENFKSPHDIVNVKVTSGDTKVQEKQKGNNKMDKDGNISTDIERFQLERTAFCSTNIINMDAYSLLPDRKDSDVSKNVDYDIITGLHPPPSPRSVKDL